MDEYDAYQRRLSEIAPELLTKDTDGEGFSSDWWRMTPSRFNQDYYQLWVLMPSDTVAGGRWEHAAGGPLEFCHEVLAKRRDQAAVAAWVGRGGDISEAGKRFELAKSKGAEFAFSDEATFVSDWPGIPICPDAEILGSRMRQGDNAYPRRVGEIAKELLEEEIGRESAKSDSAPALYEEK